MDVLIGVQCKDFVILVSDRTAARSIVAFKHDEDKIMQLSERIMMASAGEQGDRVQFTEFILRNLHLYELRTQIPLSTHALAHFTRNELATALRRHPYSTNLLIGGFDKGKGPSLFFLDYLASLCRVKKAAHGYGSYFTLSVLDRHYREDMSLDEALEMVRKCIYELHTRFIIHNPAFTIKVVDSKGIREVTLPDPPKQKPDTSAQEAKEEEKSE